MTPNISQELESCCVLRLDPTAFTVSVIVEIVEAVDIVFLESLQGVDIAYYNKTALTESDSLLKIYYSTTWISFTEGPSCNTVNQSSTLKAYPFIINFVSLLYNFASAIPETITFNLQSSSISTTP